MFVKRLELKNFKRFEKLDVEFGRFDCLVGPNNSGKTTLLQALALFDFCLDHCLGKKNSQWALKNQTISPDEFYVLPIADPFDLWTDRRTRAGNKLIKIEVTATFEGGRQVSAVVNLNFNRFGLSVETDEPDQEWLAQLHAVRISYLPVFSTFLPQEERRTPAVIEDQLARGRVSTVVRNLVLDLKNQERDKQLVGILQRVFPTFENMAIEFDEANDRYITVTYREQGRSKELDIFSAGSGFQQFVYLFGFILLRQPSVILLDEPDVHLHGTLQRALLEELRRFVANGKQVLFATHSPGLISRMSSENVLALEEKGAKRLSVAFDVYDVLDNLGELDPTELSVVQAYRRVLVLENQSDWDILSAFCAKVLPPSVWQQTERRLARCYARGNPWTKDMATLRQQLQQMIRADGGPLEMFVVADRDYYPDLDQLRSSLPSGRIRWHVWERAEIENYLLCPQAMGRVLEERGAGPLPPALFGAPFREEFGKLIEASRDSAHDHLLLAFREYAQRTGERWDDVMRSRKAREFLRKHWDTEKLSLADAKEVVLPGLKRWLQGQNLGQFADRALARALRAEDLPPEVHRLAREIADFAGVRLPGEHVE